MERITCGYHGWEYDRDGVVCKIPGGEHFKSMKAREFVLDRVRVETLGRLIFVALDDHTPPLTEFLGAEMCRRLEYTFRQAVRPVAHWTVDYQCNWKILIENTLEDYHISAVHGATAGDTPPYEQISHALEEKYNIYENRRADFDSKSMHWLARTLRADAQFTYFQYLSYPSLIFAATPLTSHLHLLTPTSATTCRARITVLLAGAESGVTGRLLRRLITPSVIKVAKRFVEEDRVICNQVQLGIAAARYPGVLGRREERVHAFQEYVEKTTARSSAAARAIV